MARNSPGKDPASKGKTSGWAETPDLWEVSVGVGQLDGASRMRKD